MSTNIRELVPSKQAENAQTTQYTATNVAAIIDKCTATNTTGVAATISINLVPSGSAAGAANLILDAKSVAPNSTYTCPEVVGHSLVAGSFISTLAGTAAAITIRISGREFT